MNYTIMVLAAYAVIMIAATVLMTNKEKSVERFCEIEIQDGLYLH